MPRMLELFCGLGGWSESFAARGWHTTGVDVVAHGYRGHSFIQTDCRALAPEFIASFDAVLASPPCEDFARAWLPWLRGDHQPSAESIELLQWSVALANRPRFLVECSRFGARHCPGSYCIGSYALWGDVPLLFPGWPRSKSRKSGLRPELRAVIPPALADTVADWFTAGLHQ